MQRLASKAGMTCTTADAVEGRSTAARAGQLACIRVRMSSRGEVHSTAAVLAAAPAARGAYGPRCCILVSR